MVNYDDRGSRLACQPADRRHDGRHVVALALLGSWGEDPEAVEDDEVRPVIANDGLELIELAADIEAVGVVHRDALSRNPRRLQPACHQLLPVLGIEDHRPPCAAVNATGRSAFGDRLREGEGEEGLALAAFAGQNGDEAICCKPVAAPAQGFHRQIEQLADIEPPASQARCSPGPSSLCFRVIPSFESL